MNFVSRLSPFTCMATSCIFSLALLDIQCIISPRFLFVCHHLPSWSPQDVTVVAVPCTILYISCEYLVYLLCSCYILVMWDVAGQQSSVAFSWGQHSTLAIFPCIDNYSAIFLSVVYTIPAWCLFSPCCTVFGAWPVLPWWPWWTWSVLAAGLCGCCRMFLFFQGTLVHVSKIGAILFKHRVPWMHGGTSLG